MRIYWVVVLTAWIASLTTLMASKVGQMSTCSINNWDLPVFTFFLSAFPALCGYLIAKEEK